MKNLFLSILSWLLHHANQHGKDQHFYKIKNKILAKYGKHICYEVQFIEGKKCYSCKGTGQHQYFDQYGFTLATTICWNCTNGWYKRSCWNILSLVRFGKYEFHQPLMRVYEDPQSKCKTFNGYVERHPSRLTGFAITILFLIYEKGYLKRWWKSAGWSWKSYWWRPSSWLNNLIHIIKNGGKSIPAIRLKVWLNNILLPITPQKKQPVYDQFDEDDLPF